MFRIKPIPATQTVQPSHRNPARPTPQTISSLHHLTGITKTVGLIVVMLTVMVYANEWMRHALGFPAANVLLLDAAWRNDCAAMRAALHDGASSNTVDSVGLTPLYYATTSANINSVKLLLAAGADPNLPQDNPPLLHACAQHDPELVNVLLQAGANPAAKDARGATPLSICNIYSPQDWPIIRSLLRAQCRI
jgi:hypothetical protein